MNYLNAIENHAGLLNLLFTLCLGIFASWIAYQQHKTNKKNLQRELNKEKMRIYNSARKIIYDINTSAIAATSSDKKKDNEALERYWFIANESQFLFDKDTHFELLALYDNAQELIRCLAQAESEIEKANLKAPSANPTLAWNTVNAYREWFAKQVEILDEKFKLLLKM